MKLRCYVTNGRWLARMFLGVGYVALLGALVLAVTACFAVDWR